MLSTTARPVSYPKGNLTQVAYDAKGNPLTITDALNQVTKVDPSVKTEFP